MQMIDVIYGLKQNNAEWNKSWCNYSTKYIELIKPVLLAVAQSRRLLGALVLLSHMMSDMVSHMMSHMMGHMMSHMCNGYPTHQKLFRQEGGEAAGGEAGEDLVS